MSEQPEVVVAETARAEVVPSAASMEVTRTEPAAVQTTGVEPAEAMLWRHFASVATTLAHTDFVPETYRGKKQAIMACLAYGHEIGLGPMQALQSVDVIKGKPTLKPEAMRAMILGAGHIFTRIEASADRAVFYGKRRDTGEEETVTFSFEDAKQLELTGKDNWRKQPRAMLSARATGELARSLFSDVIRGVSYTPEEMGDDSHGEVESPIPMDPVPEPPLRIVTRDHRDAGKVVVGGRPVPVAQILGTPDAAERIEPVETVTMRDLDNIIESTPPDEATRLEVRAHHDESEERAAQVAPIDPLPPFKGWSYHLVTNADGFDVRTCNACTHPTDQHSEIRRGCTICACRNTFPPQPDDDDLPPTAAPVVAEVPSSDSSPPPARESEAGPLPTSTFRAVHAALRDCGFGDDGRHALIGWVTKYHTTSSKGLTPDDAEVLLALLGKVKSGTIQVDFTLDGSGAEVSATNDRGVAFLRGLATRV